MPRLQKHSYPKSAASSFGATNCQNSLVYACAEKIILVVEDIAGWHTSPKVQLPTGIIREFLPPYSPQLQPAERLWSLVDEPLVNEHFERIEQLEDVLATRCCVLQQITDEIKNLTHYHWLKYDEPLSIL